MVALRTYGHCLPIRTGTCLATALILRTRTLSDMGPHLQRCDRGVDGPGVGDDGPPAAGEGGDMLPEYQLQGELVISVPRHRSSALDQRLYTSHPAPTDAVSRSEKERVNRVCNHCMSSSAVRLSLSNCTHQPHPCTVLTAAHHTHTRPPDVPARIASPQ